MLKQSLIAFLVIAPQISQAELSPGDKSNYVGTLTDALGTRRAISVSTVSEVDKSVGQLSYTTEIQAGSEYSSQSATVSPHFPDTILSCEHGREAVSRCSELGGVLETIDVPAGRFKTCKISYMGSEVWVAGVPFAYAKMRNTSMAFELSSFSAKNKTNCQ